MAQPSNPQSFCYKHGMRVELDAACPLCVADHPPLVCDVCHGESDTNIAGVACIPGAPMSIAWCVTCLRQENAVPTYIFDHDFIYVANGDENNLADWARERVTWVDRKYVGFNEYIKRITPEMVRQALKEWEEAH